MAYCRRAKISPSDEGGFSVKPDVFSVSRAASTYGITAPMARNRSHLGSERGGYARPKTSFSPCSRKTRETVGLLSWHSLTMLAGGGYESVPRRVGPENYHLERQKPSSSDFSQVPLRASSAARLRLFDQPWWGDSDLRDCLAERVGFEPTIRFWRILTFQASAFDHSATAPHAWKVCALAAPWPFRKRGQAGRMRR